MSINFVEFVISKHIVKTSNGSVYVSWDSIEDELLNAIPNSNRETIAALLKEYRA